jgi:hypothetical protein
MVSRSSAFLTRGEPSILPSSMLPTPWNRYTTAAAPAVVPRPFLP